MTSEQLFTILLSAIGGSGASYAVVKTVIKSEAKDALSAELHTIHERINNAVTCNFCSMQHNYLNDNLTDMKSKIDKIYDHFIKKD